MLRHALLVLITLAVAIGGGAASVWYALGAQQGVGAVTVGSWTAYPELGTPDANPYLRARIAREGLLALGRTEGIAFQARRDSDGVPLLRQCRYAIEGVIPPSRIWTIHAADPALSPIPASELLQGTINSRTALYRDGNAIELSVGAAAAAGNWLATSGRGPMILVLSLYDTPMSGGGAVDAELPSIRRMGCDEG